MLEAERAQHLIEKADLVSRQSTFLNKVQPHMDSLLQALGQLKHTLDRRDVWNVAEKQGLFTCAPPASNHSQSTVALIRC